MPPIVGVFVMHGRVKAPSADALDRMNRSFEYDAVSGDYARFLLEEMLPYVAKTHGLTLSTDPNDRAIAGNSSGAIAAFAAAWQRPDAFRRVFSAIGTYVGLRGGNEFPVLIRKTEPKPIRIFLQDGQNDLNNYTGNWWIANQDMQLGARIRRLRRAPRLGRRRAQLRARHGDFSRRDALAVARLAGADQGQAGGQVAQDVYQVLIPGEDWQLVSEGHRATDGPAVNATGEVFFTDPANNRIHRVGLDGKVSVFAENTNGANGMMFGPDGRLYAGATRTKQIVAYEPSGKREVVADDVPSNDIAVNVKGDIYVTDSPGKKVWLMPKGGKPRVVDEGIEYPNGVLFSPDQTLLYVSDYVGQLSWVFQIQPDGSLAHKQRYFYVHMPDAATRSARRRHGGRRRRPRLHRHGARRAGVRSDRQVPRHHPGAAAGALSNVEFGGAELRRDVHHQRRQGVQAEDEGEGRAVVAAASQAGAAAVVRALL